MMVLSRRLRLPQVFARGLFLNPFNLPCSKCTEMRSHMVRIQLDIQRFSPGANYPLGLLSHCFSVHDDLLDRRDLPAGAVPGPGARPSAGQKSFLESAAKRRSHFSYHDQPCYRPLAASRFPADDTPRYLRSSALCRADSASLVLALKTASFLPAATSKYL
jgi:hypothetical protein